MGIRPAKTIRDPDKVAWTRYSKRKPRKSYITSMPHKDLHQFRMGTMKDDYNLVLHMRSLQQIIIRDNSMESARRAANKLLETSMPGSYYFHVRVYPHHVVRENKMIAGAGADRLQKGMRRAFGRPSDCAARLDKGTDLFTVYSYRSKAGIVKDAFQKATKKLSGRYEYVLEEE